MALIPAHGDGQGIFVVSMGVIFWTLAFLAVVCRLWARQMKNVRLVVNDYAIIAAFFFGTGLVVIVLTGVLIGGLGQHAKDLRLSQLEVMAKILVAGSPVWAIANMFIKISILHLYCTIFYNKTFHVVAYTIMALSICLAIAIVLQTFLICQPFAFSWDTTIPGGHCGNQFEGYKAQAIVNIAIDCAIVLLPVPSLWNLQMVPSKKVGIYVMFSLGIVICVITGLRYHLTFKLNPLDITYTAADYALLNMLETTIGIVNTCLPVCRPSLKKLYPAVAISFATRLVYTRGSRDTNRWPGSNNTPEENANKNSFQRIDDVDQLYPLTHITGTQTENTIIGGTSARKSMDLQYQSDRFKTTKNPGNITVSQKWEVDSKSLEPRRDNL